MIGVSTDFRAVIINMLKKHNGKYFQINKEMENIIRDLETIMETINQMEIIELKIIAYKIKLLLNSVFFSFVILIKALLILFF